MGDRPLHPVLQAGLACMEAERWADAESRFRQVLMDHEDEPNALNLLGIALVQQDRFSEALPYFLRATRVAPGTSWFQLNTALALESLGRQQEARGRFQQAYSLDPLNEDIQRHAARVGLPQVGSLDEWHLLTKGQRALEQKHPDEAARIFDSACESFPGNALCWSLSGDALLSGGRPTEARQAYVRALSMDAENSELNRAWLASFLYDPIATESEQITAHRAWAQRFADPISATATAFLNTRDTSRILRVGYVSGEFCQHPCAAYLEPLFEAHNRQNIELFAYSNVTIPDSMTERLRQRCDHWRSIASLGDEAAAQLIREDRIDVLIHLGGHLAQSRPLLFAHRVAPVQVGFLAYPATSGMKAMDARITDAFIDPPSEQDCGPERLMRLSCGAFCWRPLLDAPDPELLPSGPITFGSFNNLAKLNSVVLDTWADLLLELPHARLRLKDRNLDDALVRERITLHFKRRGVGEDRLVFLTFSESAAQHLSEYHAVHIGLDPWPHPGHTTTLEALWMGVPVVSLKGDRAAGRGAESLLQTAGLSPFIALSRDEYVTKAVAAASDLKTLASLRSGLRSRIEKSPLRDEMNFAQKMEEAYRELWEAWCRSPMASLD